MLGTSPHGSAPASDGESFPSEGARTRRGAMTSPTGRTITPAAGSPRRSTEVKPIWFGSEERPLFGMFHVPESGFARAGVVVCPPFGRDYQNANYTLRCLGDEMTAGGICTLRFDYDGTGDSAGTGDEPQRVRSWLDSIASAVATMRASGVGSVFVVGMGLGATLAALVCEADENIDGLVLWDPEPSGKAYLSWQRALSAMSFSVPTMTTDGSVDAPGMFFDALTAADLRKLDLSNLGESQTPDAGPRPPGPGRHPSSGSIPRRRSSSGGRRSAIHA